MPNDVPCPVVFALIESAQAVDGVDEAVVVVVDVVGGFVAGAVGGQARLDIGGTDGVAKAGEADGIGKARDRGNVVVGVVLGLRDAA